MPKASRLASEMAEGADDRRWTVDEGNDKEVSRCIGRGIKTSMWFLLLCEAEQH